MKARNEWRPGPEFGASFRKAVEVAQGAEPWPGADAGVPFGEQLPTVHTTIIQTDPSIPVPELGYVPPEPSPEPKFTMPERPPSVWMDAGGGLWSQTIEGTPAWYSLGIYGPALTLLQVTKGYGDLIALKAMPAVRPEPAPPALLSAVGFDGKWAECGRRRPDGQWCEWRRSTHRLSLPVLVSECEKHMREVHGG